MLRCCLGAYGCPNHAWMPSLGAGLIRLSQEVATGGRCRSAGGRSSECTRERVAGG